MPTLFYYGENFVMSFYGNRLPDVISATTEERLRRELRKLSLSIGEKLEIVNIYPRNGKVYAWYFLDTQKADKVPQSEEQAVDVKPRAKKKTKKKVTKKQG